MLQKLKQRKESGFTIIEVMIVLAIAGLIMVVVFLAVPNLQKSQRNNARDSDANSIVEELSNYVANANGNFPTSACSGSACSWITYKPQQLTTYSYATSLPSSITYDKNTAMLVKGAVCSSDGITPQGGSARDYVIVYGIEGSVGHKCVQGS